MKSLAARKSQCVKLGLFKGQYSLIHHRVCKVCDKNFVSRSVRNERCSSCITHGKKHKLLNVRYEKGICVICDSEFTGRVSDCRPMKLTCSGKCQLKYARKQKGYNSSSHFSRAKQNGSIREHVVNKKVFMRDKYICQCCGIKCSPKKTNVVAKDAPRLDHIIPLSKGGSHTYDNVQTLCYYCNAQKSNKITGQLPLFSTNKKGEIKTYAFGKTTKTNDTKNYTGDFGEIPCIGK